MGERGDYEGVIFLPVGKGLIFDIQGQLAPATPWRFPNNELLKADFIIISAIRIPAIVISICPINCFELLQAFQFLKDGIFIFYFDKSEYTAGQAS